MTPPRIDRTWDDANRLSSITNIWSSIDFGYDDAGQVIWEGDEIAGSGGRTQTNYYRYPDGSVAHLHYPGGAYVRKDYTARGQLAATGWDDDENNWWMKLAGYTYLADGKVGQVDFGNGVRTGYGYDGRGMIQIVDHYRPGLQDLSWRDERDRITAFQKSYNPGSNPMENGRGDRFRYDDEGQLVEAWYNATDPANSGAGNTRYDGFSYDALGNRQGDYNYLAGRNGGSSPVRFTRRDNGLNQYVHWWPAGLDYILYHDDNSPWPGYDGFPGNGVLMADGWLVASYNALNQPVTIGSFATWATGNWMYFGYDPLGRCVKRWVGESGDVYSNPATYFHYDGWNLIQEGANAWGPARVYVHGNRVDEIVWSYNTFTGEQAFHHYDARGHCTLLTDSTGNILEQYEYDAFGQPYFYDASGNSIGAYDAQGLWAGYSLFGNRFLFTGREWLADLKLYDHRKRLYQPELGRFLQPDPKEFAAGDYNLYRYCHNDPINRSDPYGLAPVAIDGATDALAQEADTRNLTAFQSDRVFFGLFNIPWFEHATTVYADSAGQLSLSETRTDRNSERVIPPENSRLTSRVETHNHTTNKDDFYTHTRVSRGDVNRGDITGRPQEVVSPDGTRQRYRPSDAPTLEQRRQEGGILERLNDGKWERIEGGNTNVKDWTDHRNGR